MGLGFQRLCSLPGLAPWLPAFPSPRAMAEWPVSQLPGAAPVFTLKPRPGNLPLRGDRLAEMVDGRGPSSRSRGGTNVTEQEEERCMATPVQAGAVGDPAALPV